MTENSQSDKSSENSSNRLVKILVIVGIGIPVLVELMTLFNLINVQIFDDEDKATNPQSEPVAEVQIFTEGDTLFADYRSPIVIDEMRAKVSAQQWRFALRLSNPDSSKLDQRVKIDSLRLQSDQTIAVQENYTWMTEEEELFISDEWELPSGDIPVILYISSDQAISEDSTAFVRQEVQLDNLPVRYKRE